VLSATTVRCVQVLLCCIYGSCVQVLKHYSAQIKAVTDRKDQGLADDDFSVDFASMTNILILHSQSEGEICILL